MIENDPTPIVISVNWPEPPPEDGMDDFAYFTMTVKRPARLDAGVRSPSSVDWQRPVLPEIAGFLKAFAREALNDGYAIRLDAPRGYPWGGEWPRWCHAPADLDATLDELGESICTERHADAYPFSIWYIPANDPKAADLVELDRRLQWDAVVANDARARGAIWSSLDSTMYDVVAAWEYAERAVRWARHAMQHAGREVRWEPWFSDE